MKEIEIPRSGYVYVRTGGDLVGDFFEAVKTTEILRWRVQLHTTPMLCATVTWLATANFPEIFNLNFSMRTLAITEVAEYLKSQRLLFNALGWQMMCAESGLRVEYFQPHTGENKRIELHHVESDHLLSYKFVEDLLYLSS